MHHEARTINNSVQRGIKMLCKLIPQTTGETFENNFQAAFIENNRWNRIKTNIGRKLEKENKDICTKPIEIFITTVKIKEVLHLLINHVIKTCPRGKTAIRWFSQTAPVSNKHKRVEQRFPLSLKLLTKITNEITESIIETCEVFSRKVNN